MTRLLRFIFPGLSIGLLVTGYFLNGRSWLALCLIVIGLFWIEGLVLHWDWIPPAGLFIIFGAAAFGIFLKWSTEILFTAAIFALIAWDLADFNIILEKASPEDDISGLERSHLLRLFEVSLAGSGLGAISLRLQLKVSFELVVILMIFSIWGIGRMMNWLLSKEA